MKARQWLTAMVVVVLMLGVLAACIAPGGTAIDSQAAKAQESFKTILVSGKADLRGVTEVGSVLNVDGAATFNSTVNSVGALSINSVSFSGPVKYGAASSYTSGASITHGFATTPTVCFLSPPRDVTSTLTITATGFSSNRATAATAIYWWCGQ